MTESDEKLEQYLKAIERRMNFPRDVRKRVLDDLRSTIAAKREKGMNYEQIIADLGSPKQVAAERTRQMKEFACRKSPWRYLFAALAAYGAAELMGTLVTLWILKREVVLEAATIGVIGGADGPTAIFVTGPGCAGSILPVAAIIAGIWGFLWLSRCRK